MNIPAELLYTKDHEWIKIEGNFGTVGITDYAQSSLGDITFVDLPQSGQVFKQGQVLANIESVKAASDIYTPMSGKIGEVNIALKNNPELINQSPYESAWFVVIELTDLSEQNNLLSPEAYLQLLKEAGK